jgi:hypothetical protein
MAGAVNPLSADQKFQNIAREPPVATPEVAGLVIA